MSFEINKEILINPQTALKYEWLETNAMGGFAYSTNLNCATRKYHSLLNVPLFDGTRHNLLSKVEPVLECGKKVFHLSTNKYIDVYHPTGHKYITEFKCDLFPEFTYRIGDIVFKKSILMPRHQNAILLKFELSESEKSANLQISPLMAYRNMHQLTRENMFFRVRTSLVSKNRWQLDPYEGMPSFFFNFNKRVTFFPGPDWYKNFDYLKEKSRGYDHLEDLFCPGMFEYKLKPGQAVYMRAGLESENEDIKKTWDKETARRQEELGQIPRFLKKQNVKKADAKELTTFCSYIRKSDAFLVSEKRDNKPSVIAGFPWFGEWGRDTMIALPGLCLFNGKEDFLLKVLKTYSQYEKEGLFPNQLSLGSESAYNSIDSSLWFFRTLRFFLKMTNDGDSVRKHLGSTMRNILNAHFENRVPWSKTFSDSGLLSVGSPETQLTWMDAKAYGRPVTPRFGMAVEINALWFEALSLYESLFPGDLPQASETITKLKKHFPAAFIVEAEGGTTLADTILETGETFTNFRPNQLFALSIEEDLIAPDKAFRIIERMQIELLTPVGMRTLSPRDPMYKGSYHGSQDKRDEAYHQGTVWPWLFGAYADTLIKYLTPSDKKIGELFTTIDSFINEHTIMYGIYSASEIFEGNAPHRAKGCPFQAWSVGETIRAWFSLHNYIQTGKKLF